MSGNNPFHALGLRVRLDLTDDEVRAAWRRVAASTHPDLPDGGDPARFAIAAAAYAELRTAFGRGEAYADLGNAVHAPGPATRADPDPDPIAGHAATRPAPHGVPVHTLVRPMLRAPAATGQGVRLVWRMRRGRPGMLLMRVAVATVPIAVCVIIASWQPATLAISAGMLTWLVRTIRYDLAPIP